MISAERKAKIKWNCRRGMLELDLLLERFIQLHFDELSEDHLIALEALLKLQDPDLYQCLIIDECQLDERFLEIVAQIKSYRRT